MFAHFSLPNVGDVARRTTGAALVVGVAGLVAAFSFGYLLVGLGACIGLALGLLNFRLIGVSVDKVTAMDVDNPKRPLAVNTLGRMGIITVIALGLCFVSKPLGFGVLGGLAVFQIILIANVARSMAKAGPMTLGRRRRSTPTCVDDNEPVVSPAAVEAADDTRGGDLTAMGSEPADARCSGSTSRWATTSSASSARSPSTWTSCGRPASPGPIVITLGLILRVQGHQRRAGQVPAGLGDGRRRRPDQVDDSIGPRGAKVVPLALTLFIFIFTCNLFEVLGIGSKLDCCPPRPATSTCRWPWPST